MSVMVVTLCIPMRFFCDGHLLEAQSPVTPIVTEKEAYLSGFLVGLTLVTLMTVLCGSFLSAGVVLHCPRRLQGGGAISFMPKTL
jgi:hypothetical protein